MLIAGGEEELLLGHGGDVGSIVDAVEHGAATGVGANAASVRLPVGGDRPLAEGAFCVRVEHAAIVVVVHVGWWDRVRTYVAVGVWGNAGGTRRPVEVAVPRLFVELFFVVG